MYSPLHLDSDPKRVSLPGTDYTIDPVHLNDEIRLVRALHDLKKDAAPIALPHDLLQQRRQSFIDSKKARMNPDEQQEQLRIVFDELPQPSVLAIVTGPPGAAKTTVTSLWVNLVHDAHPEIPFVLITRERPALARLRDKIYVENVVPMTVDDAMQDKVVFPRNACVIVDEASLCCTKQMSVLLGKAAQAHARRVILIGDDKQLFPEGKGQPFRWLRENNKGQVIALTHSFRQKTAVLRRVVESLHRGDLNAALQEMQIDFVAHDALIKTLRGFLEHKAPERTMMVVHGSDDLVQRLRVQCAGYRVYSLSASQGLAIDEIVLVVAKPMNMSELLVGCSRQRYALDVFVDDAVYADRAALQTGLGEYPKILMALDVVGEDALLAQHA